MPFSPDLDAYFARIGDSGSRAPTLETLHRIVEAHVRTIPFENLDILLGKHISVEPADIERKLIEQKRGGYCFEQNTLLQQVLLALGYQVKPLSARVRAHKPREFMPPRTHLFLRVELDGVPWLVDVGVGSMSLTSALRLELDTPQPTPHETRRIIASGRWSDFEQRSPDAVLYHQILYGQTWMDVCEFTLEEMHPIDRELGNWFTSTHPASHFRTQSQVARSTPTGRVTLSGRELTHRDSNGHAQSRTLATHAEVLETLDIEFGLQFGAGTHFD